MKLLTHLAPRAGAQAAFEDRVRALAATLREATAAEGLAVTRLARLDDRGTPRVELGTVLENDRAYGATVRVAPRGNSVDRDALSRNEVVSRPAPTA